ncbi:MAG: FAD-dependent oxidoreductase [Deltaproteobacteria bacterium]|nr:FAD-dependent oxidoreductase [Deltaproteobacteria bacterium]
MITIEAKGLYYKALNRQIREYLSQGEKDIVLRNILGQRYIGGGLNSAATIKIYGTPGQDLGAFMNGSHIVVFGNAQDGVGNTMNAGKIVVHGKAGEIPAHSMRGGKVFIKGDVEYRAGIHMKQYMDKIPLLIIGGTAKDYCGEYMAGGRIIVMNLGEKGGSPVGNSVGTGIHGGKIYVRGNVEEYQLGIGAVFGKLDKTDRKFLKVALDEYAEDMKMDLSAIYPKDFIKITKRGHRPFGNLYTPGMNIKTEIPLHFNITPPCAYNCPTGIPTPVFLNLIKDGHIREAQLLMDEYTPLRMSVCGTTCPAPCMEGCSRNMMGDPVEIQKLAQQYYPDFDPIVDREKRREIISIVGAGPSGLSAAWQLSRRGYTVSIYDSTDDIGGKVKQAIPRERLSDDALFRDIARIKSLPIRFHTGRRIDRKGFERIYAESDIVVVSTGAQITKRIPYPGGDRIMSGLTFLMEINRGNPMDLSGKEIVIIGSGNVGMDIACESWRRSASKVTAIDIQKPLAFGRELDLAKEFGTEILWPKIIDKLDESRVYFKDGTDIRADVVFFSIGETPDTSFLTESVFIDDRGYIVTTDKSFRSSDPKVYGCGDIIMPGLITDAVGSGRLAAMEIDAHLRGQVFVYPVKNPVSRHRIQTIYFGEEESEIDRCMSCGTCIFCDKCVEHCPQEAITRNGEIFSIDSGKCQLCYTCVSVCPRGAIHVNVVIDGAGPETDN